MTIRESRDRRQRRLTGRLQGAFHLPCLGIGDEGLVVQCKYCWVWLPWALWTIDHVDPRGPRRAVRNCVIACQPCNHDKGGEPPCHACGGIGHYATKDRIAWTVTVRCQHCHELIRQKTNPRPGTAPKRIIHMDRHPSRRMAHA